MKIKTFETEDYFAKYEFTQPHLISGSDCESVSIDELIRIGGGSNKDFLEMRLGYPEMAGSAGLRSEIAATYEDVTKNQILVLGSPIEGIYLTMKSLLEKGDHVIVLSPAYDALFNLADHITGNASRWFLKQDGKTWKLDLEKLEQLLKPSTKLLVINFPHNPTGFLPTQHELNQIIDLADRNGVRIFADEIYRGLEYRTSDQLPSLADLSERAIVLSGASKSLGLPGLRFGWLATKDAAVYQDLYNLKSYTSMCATQAGEYLGKMAIRAAPALVEKNLKIIKENLAVAETFFNKWQSKFEWLKPLAGSVSLIKMNYPSAENFCHEMAENFGVVLLPTKFMGYEDEYARVGFGRTNFKAGLDVFESALANI